MAQTPEGRIKDKLDKMLKAEGVYFWPPQSGPFGKAGRPDREAVIRGLFMGIECKADRTKKPTRLQAKCLQEIEDAGGKSFLVYDDDTIDIVRQFIRAKKNESDKRT